MIPKFLNLTTRALFFKLELRGKKKHLVLVASRHWIPRASTKKQLEKRDGL